jgi:hypothetical protein
MIQKRIIVARVWFTFLGDLDMTVKPIRTKIRYNCVVTCSDRIGANVRSSDRKE